MRSWRYWSGLPMLRVSISSGATGILMSPPPLGVEINVQV